MPEELTCGTLPLHFPLTSMRPSPSLRDAQPNDANCLAVLAAQVWLHTYATRGVSHEIAQYVLSELSVEKFSALLDDPDTRVVVAHGGENLVGFACIRLGATCPSDPCATVELLTLYVQEPFTGQEVGRSLLTAAEGKAREHASGPLWLTVNAQNARAIAFYARQGYTKVGTTFFALGEGRHENHVLVGKKTSLLGG